MWIIFIFYVYYVFQGYLDDRKFADLIRVYLLAKQSLQKYADLPNVSHVCVKCEEIVAEAQVEVCFVHDGHDLNRMVESSRYFTLSKPFPQ